MNSIIILALLVIAPMPGAAEAQSDRTITQPKHVKSAEIPPEKAAEYKKEIADVCDLAATVELCEKEELCYGYRGNGERKPIPEKAQSAMDRLERLVNQMPNYPEMARAYFLLGKLKLSYMYGYEADTIYESTGDASRYHFAMPEAIRKYAEREFFYNEIGAHYYYNGYHFDKLISLFPESEWADKAGYEKTNIFTGGNSEGDPSAFIEGELSRLIIFLKSFPDSPLTVKGVERANNVFTTALKEGNQDPAYGAWNTNEYLVEAIKQSIAKYEEVAVKLTPIAKAAAFDKISELWEMVGENKKAIATANYIISEVPNYYSLNSVRDRLNRLKSPR